MVHYNIDSDSRKIVYFILAAVSMVASYFLNRSGIQWVSEIAAPSGIFLWGLLVAFYDKVLWKTRLGDLLCSIPNLDGEWEGQIERMNIKTKKKETVNLKLSISQTWLKISIINEGKRTRSYSQSVFMEVQNKKNISLKWIYFAEDIKGYSEENLYGEGVTSLVLKVIDGKRILTGKYYSSKMRKGPYEVSQLQNNE